MVRRRVPGQLLVMMAGFLGIVFGGVFGVSLGRDSLSNLHKPTPIVATTTSSTVFSRHEKVPTTTIPFEVASHCDGPLRIYTQGTHVVSVIPDKSCR